MKKTASKIRNLLRAKSRLLNTARNVVCTDQKANLHSVSRSTKSLTLTFLSVITLFESALPDAINCGIHQIGLLLPLTLLLAVSFETSKKLFVHFDIQAFTIMRIYNALLPIAVCLGLVVQIAICTESKQIQRKQTMPSFLSTIGAMVPSMVSNVLPLVVMFSIGALLVPTLGLSSLLRQGKQRSLSTFTTEASAFLESVGEVFEKFTRAVDKMEQKYH